jgi:acyl dehydratase
MALRYPDDFDLAVHDVPVPWTDRETILYALSIGLGSDPLDRSELPFVWEKELKAVPTMGTVVASSRLLLMDLPIDLARTVAVGQSIVLHRPIPALGPSAVSDCRVANVWDRGADKGAVVAIENILKSAVGGDRIATAVTTLLARGDGGCGAPSEGQPPPHMPPSRAPDRVVDVQTRWDQPLLYRLNGDRHPLHVDPDFGPAVGFDRPIMHGLCTFGMICRVAMRAFADNDPARIASHEARFSGALYPGETMSVRLWREGSVVAFEADAKDRGVRVISNGRMELH